MNQEEFDRRHTYPDQEGVERLYKFKAYDPDRPEILTDIFQRGVLYHPTPNQLNDPWEGRAAMLMPRGGAQLAAARQRLMRVARQMGRSEDRAAQMATHALANRDRLQEIMMGSIERVSAGVRIGSFSAERDHGLLWSHYAEAHSGFSIEYSTSVIPFGVALKVAYQKDYPSILYPHSRQAALSAILTKSTTWSYEREYRTLIVPDAGHQIPNNGFGAIIPPDSVTGVYFGARMNETDRSTIIEIINQGPFNPRLYQAKLQSEAYQLDYEEIDPAR